MNATETRIDEILSNQLLHAVDEEAQTLFWMDGNGGALEWRKASDDVAAPYIERAKKIVAGRLREGFYPRQASL